jgi:hypothetical protein
MKPDSGASARPPRGVSPDPVQEELIDVLRENDGLDTDRIVWERQARAVLDWLSRGGWVQLQDEEKAFLLSVLLNGAPDAAVKWPKLVSKLAPLQREDE